MQRIIVIILICLPFLADAQTVKVRKQKKYTLRVYTKCGFHKGHLVNIADGKIILLTKTKGKEPDTIVINTIKYIKVVNQSKVIAAIIFPIAGSLIGGITGFAVSDHNTSSLDITPLANTISGIGYGCLVGWSLVAINGKIRKKIMVDYRDYSEEQLKQELRKYFPNACQ